MTGTSSPCRHVEIAPELLAHHIGGDLRRSKERVQTGIDRHALVDAVAAVGVVVAGGGLAQRQLIGPVTVDLVGAGKAERRVAAKVPRGHQQVEGTHRVDVEIVIGNRRRLIVGRLSGGVNDKVGALVSKDLSNALAVADVERTVAVVGKRRPQAFDDRAGRALLPEELTPHIVVEADHVPALFGQEPDTSRADQTSGSGDKRFHSSPVPAARVGATNIGGLGLRQQASRTGELQRLARQGRIGRNGRNRASCLGVRPIDSADHLGRDLGGNDPGGRSRMRVPLSARPGANPRRPGPSL